MPTLGGALVRLEPATRDHVTALAAIRRSPQVHDFWRGGDDLVAAVNEDLQEPGSTPYVIECDGRVVGWIQWSAEDDPDYRYASIDIYLDPAVHGRGLGTDAVRTMARHLIDDHGHHRLEIDPAADNVAAIRCYSKVGFRPVGIRRNSERGNDGSWHDGLLMDLLAAELSWFPMGLGCQGGVATGTVDWPHEPRDWLAGWPRSGARRSARGGAIQLDGRGARPTLTNSSSLRPPPETDGM